MKTIKDQIDQLQIHLDFWTGFEKTWNVHATSCGCIEDKAILNVLLQSARSYELEFGFEETCHHEHIHHLSQAIEALKAIVR